MKRAFNVDTFTTFRYFLHGEIYTILFNTVNVVYYRITLMMYNDIMQITKKGERFKRNGRNENA